LLGLKKEIKSISRLLPIALVIGLISCSDSNEITIYSIPKEEIVSAPAKGFTGSALGKYLTETMVGNLSGHLVQAENEGQAIRIFVVKFAGKTWFFKLMGNAELAVRERENFDKFVESIDIQSEQGQDQWFIPEGWEPGKKSSMRIGSFSVKDGKDSSLDISVTSFPGDLGGLLPNVERWLGQIGLEPGKDSK
jgi:hypothetical protein